MPTSFTYVCRMFKEAMASIERWLHHTGRLQYLAHVRVIWGLVKLVNVEVTAVRSYHYMQVSLYIALYVSTM